MRKPLSFTALLGSSQTGEIHAPPPLSNVVNSSILVDGLTGEKNSEFRPFFPMRSRKRRVAKNATLSTPIAEVYGQASTLSPRQIHIHQTVSIEGGTCSAGQQLREVRQRLNLGGSCNAIVEQSATCVGEPYLLQHGVPRMMLEVRVVAERGVVAAIKLQVIPYHPLPIVY